MIQNFPDEGISANVVSRFNIGEYEVIPKSDDVMIGDANGDGRINICDVTAVQKQLAGISLPYFSESSADIDGGGLSISDAVLIQKYIVGYRVDYPIGKMGSP